MSNWVSVFFWEMATGKGRMRARTTSAIRALRTRSAIPLLAVLGGLTGGSGSLLAADIDRAVIAYNQDHFAEAANLFYGVLTRGNSREARLQAQYYLAQALLKDGYYLAAYQFYGDVFNAGEEHPYFLNATAGLLKVAHKIGDDVLIPELVNRGYTKAFQRLDPEELFAINYMIGVVSQRHGQYEDAKRFLKGVFPESSYHARARYILGVLALKSAEDRSAEDYSEAIRYFDEVERALRGASSDKDKKLFRLALLGKARAYYSQGNFGRSIEFYERVPRFSEDWIDAMFESGWAYFQDARFGRALGMAHSILSPYFDDRLRAEVWVLKATTYFQMCHFDRVRKTLSEFFRIHEPMAKALTAWRSKARKPSELIRALGEGSPGLPGAIRRQIARNRRFKKFLGQVKQAEQEIQRATTAFPEGAFKASLLVQLSQERAARRALTAKLVHEQLAREAAWLKDFLNHGQIIKFESADAERRILEAGRDLKTQKRVRGARPTVSNAKYQYWAFEGEYWLDELGYYEHAIKNECMPEVYR